MSETDSAAQNNTEAAEASKTDSAAQNNTEAAEASTTDTEASDAKTSLLTDGIEASDADKAPAETESQAGVEYTDFKLPDGFEVDSQPIAQFSALAAENKLSQAAAQQMIDLAAETITQSNRNVLEQQFNYWDKTRKDWVAEIKSDAEFGGDKFDETIMRAKRTLKEYGSHEMVKFLDESGFGDNADFIRMLAKIDRRLSDDNLESGKPTSAGQESMAKILYPDMK